ncbi:MAG: rod shape-determining protein MreC [Nitrospirae bacterium]|nr:rod shape-determining protein MreC [Nitrospirota bacterium]
MSIKKRSFVYVVFVLLIVALLAYQSIKGSRDTSTFDFLIYPLKVLERGSISVIHGVKNFFNSYILTVGKEDENRRLMAKIKEYEKDRSRFADVMSENKRLRDLLELKSQRVDYVTSAGVIARDPTNWFQIFWINKGVEDGIRKDMVAVTPSGLVGKIHKVLPDTANIILITDINSSVAVRFQSHGLEGILEGKGTNKCYLKYVPQEEDVKIGERLITSGLDGIYPEGLRGGFVSKVIKKGYGLFQYIEVTPMQNLNAIQEVAILKR